MSAVPGVTAQDLELEHAELLPARETLMVGIDPRIPMRLYHPGPVHPGPQPMYPWNPGGTYYPPGPMHAWGE
jgi:hypothetical protein